LTSGTGEQFVNADGFGITWHTDARSEFNPLKDEPSPGEQVVVQGGLLRNYDGLSLPFVRGPHPAMYKTIIAKPWVPVAFITLNLSFPPPFPLLGSMILLSSHCVPTFRPSAFSPTFEVLAALRLRPPIITRLFLGATALCIMV